MTSSTSRAAVLAKPSEAELAQKVVAKLERILARSKAELLAETAMAADLAEEWDQQLSLDELLELAR